MKWICFWFNWNTRLMVIGDWRTAKNLIQSRLYWSRIVCSLRLNPCMKQFKLNQVIYGHAFTHALLVYAIINDCFRLFSWTCFLVNDRFSLWIDHHIFHRLKKEIQMIRLDIVQCPCPWYGRPNLFKIAGSPASDQPPSTEAAIVFSLLESSPAPPVLLCMARCCGYFHTCSRRGSNTRHGI